MLESKIERACCKWAKSLGIMNKKLTHDKGDTDRIFLYQGGVFFVEFKAPGEEARAIQIYRHQELEAQGFLVMVIDDVEVFKRVVTVWLRLKKT